MIIDILKDKLTTWILRIKQIFLINSLNCLIQSWIMSMDKLSLVVVTSAAKGKLQSRGIFAKAPLGTVLLKCFPVLHWYWTACHVCDYDFNIMTHKIFACIATKRIISFIIIK